MKTPLCILLQLATVTAFLPLVSCDGSNDGEEDLTLEERDSLTADSLSSTEIYSGDRLQWQPNDATEPKYDIVTFSAGGTASQTNNFFSYSKTGEKLFVVERTSSYTAQQRLSISLSNTLLGTSTNAQLGSRLRELIHRDDPDFTEDELKEIISILNPSGATLSLLDDGTLVTSENDTYTHLVTSSREERNNGTMGGTYYIESDAINVVFRNPTQEEMNAIRFLGADDWIPDIGIQFYSDERVESGNWELELTL